MNTPKDNSPGTTSNTNLLSPINVWGLSLGCAVGWGAFMLPGNLFLPNAGPVGSIIAIALGSVIMLIIGSNFCALAKKYPGNGGFFAYVRESMGYDHAFLTAWAMIITYMSIVWANATAIVLLVRFLFGDVLQWGFHYQVAGFDVYGGEIITTWAVLIVFGLFTAYAGKGARLLNTCLAIILIAGIILLYSGVLAMSPQHGSFYPAFDPDIGGTPFLQILSILMITPWMFFGFESVTFGSKAIQFSPEKLFSLIVFSIITIFLAYSLPIAISVLSIPEGFLTWNEYINTLNSLTSYDSMPVFHSVIALLGDNGFVLLVVTLLSAITTGIIGLYRGCAYLLQIMSKDHLLPEILSKQAEDGTPRNALLCLTAISLFIPFLGRTAIVWLVDAITISGSIAYAYISLCRYREAKADKHPLGKFLGATGLIISVLFFFCPIIPNLLLGSNLATESYLLLAVWSILGLIYYWYVFKHDKQGRFGKSFSMCIILLFLNFFTTSLWLRQLIVTKIPLIQNGGFRIVRELFNQSSIIQGILITLILLFMADIFTTMRKREHQLSNEVLAEQKISRLQNSLLGNMTHDISLTMNAIMSYVNEAKQTWKDIKDKEGKRESENFDSLLLGLKHTISISEYFQYLVNTMKKTDRIQSKKMVLYPIATDIRYDLNQIKDIFVIQMQNKEIDFNININQLDNPYVYCEKNRLQRILLNLINVSYEFTSPGGTIEVELTQIGSAYHKPPQKTGDSFFNLYGDYEFKIKDSGFGMPDNFTMKIWDKLDWHNTETKEPERSLSIIKHLIELFNGSISFVSEPGKGTVVIIRLTLKLAKPSSVTVQLKPEDMVG